jgi:uncharacterized protein involved in exopolysaccharide biosynthesis
VTSAPNEPREERPDGSAGGSGEGEDGGFSFPQILVVLLNYRRSILALSLVTALVVGVFVLVRPRNYTASGSFIPQGVDQSLGGFAQLAGQLGFALPTSGSSLSESPEFYASLLRSREILGKVLTEPLELKRVRWGDTLRLSGTLLDLLEIEASSPERRREEGLRWLDEHVTTLVDRRTSLVRISVTTPWPEVSERISRRMLDLVDDFNRAQRQTQAAAERTFIEGRMAEAKQDFEGAENELRGFLEANRQFQASPQLQFEHDRLQREVGMRQQLYTALSQGYEDARIAEVRNTPLITVVEGPQRPVLPDRRRLPLKVLLAFIGGGILAIALAFVREFLGGVRRSGDRDYLILGRAWDQTVTDVRRIFRRR